MPNSLSVPITMPKLSNLFVYKISIFASCSINQNVNFTHKLSKWVKWGDQCVLLAHLEFYVVCGCYVFFFLMRIQYHFHQILFEHAVLSYWKYGTFLQLHRLF